MKIKVLRAIRKIKCKFGNHSMDYKKSVVSYRTGSVSLLDNDWRIKAELMRQVECIEGKCKYCDEDLVMNCEAIDTPIGI